ncbi:hypothetical protein ACLQ2S_26230 [Micromonospora sp. DT48]|uniref:hypothetical protein n=1 Tax=Micromonospora sp. DT48 TaxID=3393429 RepID=UPI003CECC5A8
MDARYRTSPPLRLDGLPEAQAAALRASLDAGTAGVIDADTPAYLIYSNDLLVAWCTVRARVVTPDLVLSGAQVRHQRLAVQALSDLSRQALIRLADVRPDTDHAGIDAVMQHKAAVWVASAGDLTTTAAMVLDADLAVAEATVRQSLFPQSAGALVVLNTTGFGAYGKYAHRPALPVLCAIRRIAAAHRLAPAVVGDWIAADGGTNTDLPVDDLPGIFDADFVGVYSTRSAYAEQHMTDSGWTEAIVRLGIPARYVNINALQRDLFDHTVQAVETTSTSGFSAVAVFRRISPAAGRV